MNKHAPVHTLAVTIHAINLDPSLRQALTHGHAAARMHDHESIEAFLAAGHPATPGCAVLGLPLPDKTAADALQMIDPSGSGIPVLVIAEHADVATAVKCMKLGAADFLAAPVTPEHLRRHVDAVARLCAERAQANARLERHARRFAQLSAREREVLDLIMDGFNARDIGRRLGISRKTVDTHRVNFVRKVGAESAAQAISMAFALRYRGLATTLPLAKYLP